MSMKFSTGCTIVAGFALLTMSVELFATPGSAQHIDVKEREIKWIKQQCNGMVAPRVCCLSSYRGRRC